MELIFQPNKLEVSFGEVKIWKLGGGVDWWA